MPPVPNTKYRVVQELGRQFIALWHKDRAENERVNPRVTRAR